MQPVSVVIPVLDAADTLAEQLDAVLGQEGVDDLEVVVVDNGSTDGTLDVIAIYAESDSRVRLVDGSAVARGGAAAKNLGVSSATFDLIAFCDADDLVRPGWLRCLVEALECNEVTVVTREYWSLNPGLSRRLQPEKRLFDLVFGVPSISGGAFGIRRSVYQQVGGFDETFLGSVDTEFSLRLRGAGFVAVPVPAAQISIRLPTSPRQMFKRHRMLARSWRHIEFRHGVRAPEYSWGPLSKTAVALVVHCGRLLSPGGRMAWAKLAGSFVGRVECRLTSRPQI